VTACPTPQANDAELRRQSWPDRGRPARSLPGHGFGTTDSV